MKRSLLFLILCLWLVMANAGKIAFYGDTRSNHEIHAQIAEAIARHDIDLAIHTGDLVQSGTTDEEYDRWFEISQPILETAILHAVRGNHEKDLELFIRRMGIRAARSYYTVTFDSLQFILLDSNLDLSPQSDQYTWLMQRLEDPRNLPQIIIMHHPVFSTGYHKDLPSLQLMLPQMLQNTNVLAVISGHNHSYERSFYNGKYYLVTAGGGAPIRDPLYENPYSQVFYNNYNYIIVDRIPGGISFKAYDINDNEIDSFSILFPKP